MDAADRGILGRYKKLIARRGKIYVTNENRIIKKYSILRASIRLFDRMASFVKGDNL